jgi:Cu-Zn family superoxide dismutase
MRTTLALAGTLVLAGCAGMAGPAGGPAATADLVNVRGERVGTAVLTEAGGTVRLRVEATGLAPGPHGIHIHAVGRCEPPGFTSAGGHFNPLGRKHGLEAADGAHAGDLPNLVADAAGRAHYEATTRLVSIGGGLLSLFDADGSAVVIHERADDQRTDPTGDSGGRVACGVVTRR